MNAIVIPCAGAEPIEVIDLPDDAGARWARLRELVGGYLEAIRPPIAGTIAYIHDEGKAVDAPRNEAATALVDLWLGDYIAGPMVVCGLAGPDETSLTDEQIVAVLGVLA